MMRRKRAACTAVMLAAASRLAAQQTRPYQPAFDVQDYAIAIELPDTGAVVHAVATLTISRTAPADTLRLDLMDLTVKSVAINGRSTAFTRTAESIAIPMPRGLGSKSTFSVSVDYGGAVRDGLIVRTDSAGRWTYFGDNWPNRARHWIPSIDHPSDKATVSWRVTAPESRTVIANGKLVSKKPATGSSRIEWTWRETRRIPVYLMVIGAGPLDVFDLGDTACGLADGQRCVPQSVYTAPEQRSFMPGPFARAGEIVQLFSRLVAPFPYEKLAHVQSATRFGGMENASEIFYADAAFRKRTMSEGLIAHETAHQWFGDAVTEREWSHLWLSEGFATYFAALWERAARGDSAFRQEMATIRRTVLDDTASVPKHPVIDTIETNLLALLNRNSYQKGGFVLHMLRAQVGERAFFDALREYYTQHKHATAVTDDLRIAMEHASKQSLGWFFDQWLRRPGYPDAQATWTYDAAAHGVDVTITQQGSFGAFQFPLTLAVVDSAGSAHRATVQVTAAGGHVRVPLATPPAEVVLDPDVELLARLRVVHQ